MALAPLGSVRLSGGADNAVSRQVVSERRGACGLVGRGRRDCGPFLLGLLALSFGQGLALAGFGHPPTPLLDPHLCFLELRERVGGFGPSGLELDSVVLVGGVQRAQPFLEDFDPALEPRHLGS